MLWPALRALSIGELTAAQEDWLREAFDLSPEPRREGPGAAQSIAHRTFTDDAGNRLVLDVARTGDTGWVFALFREGAQASPAVVEAHRALFHDAIDRLGLDLVEITPAATAAEVHVPAADFEGDPASAFGAHWTLPEELDRVWFHLGLREDAPAEVKQAKLRELMSTPAWNAVPAGLKSQAAAFLAAN
ncbi:hypothetical protein [Streptomyces sp. NPDC051993]|uniref:hypothetical protein n=1 Tax=Streptomyces sp. NPDC051993 TaxID=3155286 RepID=UPI0034135923